MAKPKQPALIKLKKAVALSYKPDQDQAPKVSAKGAGTIAEKILALAKEHDIPIKEDPDLVEILAKLEVNQEIPPELYTVVAEILAFVHRSNEKWLNRVNRDGSSPEF